jgi:hypothetical protein
VSVVAVSKRAAPRLQTPLARAWRRYQRKTKVLQGAIYEEAEPWAWLELELKLQKIREGEEDDGA